MVINSRSKSRCGNNGKCPHPVALWGWQFEERGARMKGGLGGGALFPRDKQTDQ